MSYIEQLKSEVDALARLLADPHPGLAVWALAANQRIANIRMLTEPSQGNQAKCPNPVSLM